MLWSNQLRRRVQHYGYRYDYKQQKQNSDLDIGPLPSWLHTLATTLCKKHYFNSTPNQVIINEYTPGQGIAAHTDCANSFGNTIASLSLISPYTMDFTHDITKDKVTLRLEDRSLLILSGQARYTWKHGIAARKNDRYQGILIPRGRRVSITFRNVI